MERGAKEKNHQLYKPYTNGEPGLHPIPRRALALCPCELGFHTCPPLPRGP